MGEAVTQDQPGAANPGTVVAGAGGGTGIGPLDHQRPQGSDMADPDGHCRWCGAAIPKGSHKCPECGIDTEDMNKIINDFVDAHKGQTPQQIQDAWQQSDAHQEAIKKKEATKSQIHGL